MRSAKIHTAAPSPLLESAFVIPCVFFVAHMESLAAGDARSAALLAALGYRPASTTSSSGGGGDESKSESKSEEGKAEEIKGDRKLPVSQSLWLLL